MQPCLMARASSYSSRQIRMKQTARGLWGNRSAMPLLKILSGNSHPPHCEKIDNKDCEDNPEWTEGMQNRGTGKSI